MVLLLLTAFLLFFFADDEMAVQVCFVGSNGCHILGKVLAGVYVVWVVIQFHCNNPSKLEPIYIHASSLSSNWCGLSVTIIVWL